MIEILAKLPRNKIGKLGQKYGFREIPYQVTRYGQEYKNDLLKQIIITTYHFRVAGKSKKEANEIQIYWIYPDFIVFNGRKDVIEKAIPHFTSNLERLGVMLTLDRVNFEWYYLLKIFELCQEMGIWKKKDIGNRGPIPIVAEGVTIRTIEDVSTEWERESTQAKIVVAKGAHDCTQDLSTCVTILQGRKLQSLVAIFEMESDDQEVRLNKGGTLLIRKGHSSKVRRTPQGEIARLLWGLEFTRRLYQAHSKWLQLPIDEKLPHEDVFRRSYDVAVAELKPVLTESLDICLKNMTDLREELKKQEESMVLESGRLAKEV